LLQPDCIVVIEGTLGWDLYTDRSAVTAEKVYSLSQARELFAKAIEIGFNGTCVEQGVVKQLAQLLTPFRQGRCAVAIYYHNGVASTRFTLGEEWRVQPTEALLSQLQTLPGAEHVQIMY
jgi:DNA polymerase III subunit alpha